MKNFTFLFTLLLLSLGFAFQANATTPDCGCDDNKLTNGSFEQKVNGEVIGWSKTNSTNFGNDGGYNMCGDKNGLITGPGSIWQEVQLTAGTTVNVKVYGGTHDNDETHEFQLIFYKSNGDQVGSTVVTNMDFEVGSGNQLRKYTMSAVAPANAVKVRFRLKSTGNYFKVDGACLTLVAPEPPVDCSCVDATTLIKNNSFENGTANWSSGGGSGFSFSQDQSYNMCGTYNGLLYKQGAIWQDVALVAGTKVDVSAYGGTHNNGISHKFILTFYDGAGNQVGSEVSTNMDYVVTDSKLKQFNVSGTAPAGAVKVRFTVYSAGDYFKVDAICLSITEPATCQGCNGNAVQNASFENGIDKWEVTGTLTTEAIYAVCGAKGAKLSGAGKFWQDVEVLNTFGSQVTLTIYGAYNNANSQKFQLVFLNEAKTEIGTPVTKDVTKALSTNPWGLEKYTLAGTVPSGTKYVRVLASSAGNDFLVDNACLTFSGPPLPVTLSAFNAKKEGSTAQLTWATTFESNSAYFEVLHSQDGKNWTVLAQVEAKGESKDLETYNYTHTNPLAVNLYRLKMVDLDETYTYSIIKSLRFDGDEQIKVYPNPTTDRITVSSNQQITNVKLYSQSGALVMNTAPNSSNEVDLTKLAQGTYFVKINDGQSMRKILVVR